MKPVNRNEPPAEAPSKAGKEQKAAKKGAPKAKRPASETQRLRLSVLCGVLTALTFASLAVGGWQLSQALAIRDSYQADLVSAVTLTADVAAGEVIEAGDVTVSEVPSAFAPADRATETSEVIGLRANSRLTAGNAVSLSSLQASSDPATLAQAPREGYVAYMVSLSQAPALSSLLHVGDTVQVIAGLSGESGTVIFDAVRVIALDDALTGSSDDYSRVTLELTEEQATELYGYTDLGRGPVHLTLLPAEPAQAQ